MVLVHMVSGLSFVCCHIGIGGCRARGLGGQGRGWARGWIWTSIWRPILRLTGVLGKLNGVPGDSVHRSALWACISRTSGAGAHEP